MNETDGLIAEEFLAKLGALEAADFCRRADEVMFSYCCWLAYCSSSPCVS